MEENTGDSRVRLKKNRWRTVMNVVILVFFIITIFMLAYIVYLYYPLKEQIMRDCYKNVTNLTLVNLTNLGLDINITP